MLHRPTRLLLSVIQQRQQQQQVENSQRRHGPHQLVEPIILRPNGPPGAGDRLYEGVAKKHSTRGNLETNFAAGEELAFSPPIHQVRGSAFS